MAPRLLVRTEPYYDAAQLLTGPILGPAMGASERLCLELDGCPAMAGSDPGGTEWAGGYDSAAAGAVRAAQDLFTATFRIGLLLEQTGRNHERAEAASTPGAEVPDPWTFDPGWHERLRLPPSVAGGTTPTPLGWSLVEHWVGYLWPNGHQDRLRCAARAWHESGRLLTDAGARLWRVTELVAELDSPEVADALATLDALRGHYADLGHAHTVLGAACDALAEHIDQMHAAVEDALVELIAWTAGIEAAGAVLSFFTFGLAEGPTQGEVAARILATADKIKDLYATFRLGVAACVDTMPRLAELTDTVQLALAPMINARIVYAGVLDVRTARTTTDALIMEARAQKGLADTARLESTVTKAESPIWRTLKPFRGKTKTNGLSGSQRRYYEWDHRHSDIEVYDSNRKHLGSMDPVSGVMTKPALQGREVKL